MCFSFFSEVSFGALSHFPDASAHRINPSRADDSAKAGVASTGAGDREAAAGGIPIATSMAASRSAWPVTGNRNSGKWD